MYIFHYTRFDLVVVSSGLIAGIIGEAEQAEEKSEYFEVILILRFLRVVKLLGTIKRFRIIINTIAIIIPSLITYMMLVLTVFYVFSMIGLELFGNTIKNQELHTLNTTQVSYNCHNDFITNTDFSKYLNFFVLKILYYSAVFEISSMQFSVKIAKFFKTVIDSCNQI